VKDELSVVFTGNIGEAQGLEQLVPLARKLKQLGHEECIHFTLVGEGRFKNTLMSMIDDESLTSMFTFTGRVSSGKIPTILRSHDIALLSLSPNPLFDKTIPAKLQTYLSVGMPIYGLVGGEAKHIIEESQSGYTANQKDLSSQVELLLNFLGKEESDMKAFRDNATAYSKNHFDKNKLMNEMDRHLNNQPLKESGEIVKETNYV